MKLWSSYLLVSINTIGSRFLGFIRTILQAHLLGNSIVADALSTAIKFPGLLRRLLAEGALNATFIPIFSDKLKKNKTNALEFAQNIFSFLFYFLLILIIFVEIFTPQILSVFVPGYLKTPDRFAHTVFFTRIIFPFIFFIALTALYSGILNTFSKFGAASSSPMIGNLILILAIVCGTAFIFSTGTIFAIGVILCGIGQLLWVIIPSYKMGIFLYPKLPRITSSVKIFFAKLIPIFTSSGILQINVFVGAMIASFLPQGGPSILEYANKLIQFPISVIGTAIGTVLLPLLSKQLQQSNQIKALETQSEALKISILLSIPATIGIICLSKPLVIFIFESGKFSREASEMTTTTLIAFAIGLPAYTISKILSVNFFARQETKIPALIALFSVIVDIIFSYLLIKPMGVKGLALATSIAAWFNTLLLSIILYRKGDLILKKYFYSYTFKVLFAALTSFYAIKFIKYIIPDPFSLQHSWWGQQLSFLIIQISIALIIFFGSAFLFGVFAKKKQETVEYI